MSWLPQLTHFCCFMQILSHLKLCALPGSLELNQLMADDFTAKVGFHWAAANYPSEAPVTVTQEVEPQESTRHPPAGGRAHESAARRRTASAHHSWTGERCACQLPAQPVFCTYSGWAR